MVGNSKSSAEDSNATKDGKREASSLAPLKITDRQVGQHVIFPENSKFWDGVGPSTYKGKIAKANNVNGPLDYHKHGPKRRKHTKTYWKAKGPAQNKYVGIASSSLIVSNTFDPLANATEKFQVSTRKLKLAKHWKGTRQNSSMQMMRVKRSESLGHHKILLRIIN